MRCNIAPLHPLPVSGQLLDWINATPSDWGRLWLWPWWPLARANKQLGCFKLAADYFDNTPQTHPMLAVKRSWFIQARCFCGSLTSWYICCGSVSSSYLIADVYNLIGNLFPRSLKSSLGASSVASLLVLVNFFSVFPSHIVTHF